MIRHWDLNLVALIASIVISGISYIIYGFLGYFGLDISILDYLSYLVFAVVAFQIIWFIADRFSSHTSLHCELVAWRLYRELPIKGADDVHNVEARRAVRSLRFVHIYVNDDGHIVCRLNVGYSDLLEKSVIKNHALAHYLHDSFGRRFNRSHSFKHSILVLESD